MVWLWFSKNQYQSLTKLIEADQDMFREWFDLCFKSPQPNDSIQVDMRVNSTSIWPSVQMITIEFKGAPQIIPLEEEPEIVVVALRAARAPTRHMERRVFVTAWWL
jgi:hypothetical protein